MSQTALVLIPGLMCDQAVWAGQCQALRARGVAFRVAEHGLADSLSAMARAVLDANPGPLAVIGHSMGGRVALEIARQGGARLRGAALLDTGYRALAPGEAGERERAARTRLLELARREGIRAMANTWLNGMVHPERMHDAALLEAIIEMFERRSVAQLAAQVKALLERPGAAGILPGIAVPALLLCGEQDQWSPPAQHREMAQLIPASVFSTVADCGHMSPMEQPAAVNAALLSWLDRVLT
jgi:pimeloyl-ACP methyl ester carboxylesterase